MKAFYKAGTCTRRKEAYVELWEYTFQYLKFDSCKSCLVKRNNTCWYYYTYDKYERSGNYGQLAFVNEEIIC